MGMGCHCKIFASHHFFKYGSLSSGVSQPWEIEAAPKVGHYSNDLKFPMLFKEHFTYHWISIPIRISQLSFGWSKSHWEHLITYSKNTCVWWVVQRMEDVEIHKNNKWIWGQKRFYGVYEDNSSSVLKSD